MTPTREESLSTPSNSSQHVHSFGGEVEEDEEEKLVPPPPTLPEQMSAKERAMRLCTRSLGSLPPPGLDELDSAARASSSGSASATQPVSTHRKALYTRSLDELPSIEELRVSSHRKAPIRLDDREPMRVLLPSTLQEGVRAVQSTYFYTRSFDSLPLVSTLGLEQDSDN
jgi:hypothetical protein